MTNPYHGAKDYDSAILFHRTAWASDTDELGHVNNAVYVKWVQDVGVAHWFSVIPEEMKETHIWVCRRHEIDYRSNIAAGETVTAETWIDGLPKGAKSDRRVDFRNAAGKVIVSARTTWAMLDKETQRLVRVRYDVIAPFQPQEAQ